MEYRGSRSKTYDGTPVFAEHPVVCHRCAAQVRAVVAAEEAEGQVALVYHGSNYEHCSIAANFIDTKLMFKL